jgi:hypothetical protein
MARIRRYQGRVEVWLDDRECAALLRAVDELRDDVTASKPAEGAAPAAARLRPRAYDDPAMESEFQRYAAPEITALHGADVTALREDLAGKTQPLRLDDDRALLWLRSLNLLRLAAGGRLGIEEDGWEEAAAMEAEDEVTWAMFMDLGWVQEAILSAMEA